MVNDVSVLAELALYIARLPAEQPLPLRLCAASATFLGSRGGSVALTTLRGAPVVLAATDAVAEQVEALQELLGAGPRVEATATARPATLVVGPSVGGSSSPVGRTDSSSPLAQRLRASVGPICLRSFPMVVSGSVLGVLSVHLAAGGTLSRGDDEALVVASIVGGALLRDGGHAMLGDGGTSSGHVPPGRG